MTTEIEIGVTQFTGQGTPRIASSHQNLGRGKERFFPRTFRGNMDDFTDILSSDF